MKTKLFEIDDRGCVSQLSVFSCGVAPCGGLLVAARSKSEAFELAMDYRNGYIQKGTAYNVEGFDYPIKNCIVKIGL